MNEEILSSGISEVISLIHPVLAGSPRLMAAFLILPLFAKAIVPRQIRIAFLLVLVIFAYPHLSVSMQDLDWNLFQWMGFVVKELFVGALIGYAVSMLLWVMTAIGELMDVQTGFTNAQIFDPFGNHPKGPLSALMSQVGVLFFVGFGGLHVFIQLLYDSYVLWPPVSFTPDLSIALRDFMIGTSGSFLEYAVRLASPVIGALLLIELGIGLINRAAPQLNAFYFSMPIKAVSALLVLSLLLTHLADVFRDSLGETRYLLPKLDRIWQGN